MLGRKGHVPTLLLFLFSIILVAAAWFSFLTFDGRLDSNGDEVAQAMYISHFERAFIDRLFYRMVNVSVEKADKNDFIDSFNLEIKNYARRVENQTSLSGNFFGQIRNDKFSLTEKNGIYTFQIDNVFTNVERSNHKIKQEFNLTTDFTIG